MTGRRFLLLTSLGALLEFGHPARMGGTQLAVSEEGTSGRWPWIAQGGAGWPRVLRRWGVSPAVAALWMIHEVLVALAPWVPMAIGPNPQFFRVPWYHFDVGWYFWIARAGYLVAHAQMAAYFPGVSAYLWLTHSVAAALVGLQLLLLGLVVQVGRLASAWGLSAHRVEMVQALVLFSPALIFYSTAYPEAWVAVGLCGALLAMRSDKPWQAALWSAVAGLADPLGLLVGVGAAAWALGGVLRRAWPDFRAGVAWGLGSVAALSAVMVVLAVNLGRPLEFIGAQQAWNARWLWPGAQVVQALTASRILPAALAALGMLPVVLVGAWTVLKRARESLWHLAVAALAGTFLLVPLAFYSNRAPLSSTALFLSLDVPAAMGMAALASRRLGWASLLWYGGWGAVGAVLFTHGWFWG